MPSVFGGDFQRALQALESFPLTIPRWGDLDAGTQATALINVIEAFAAIGFGAAEPHISFLVSLADWNVGSRIAQWFEPTLLRLRMKNALDLGHDDEDIDRLLQYVPQFTRLLPFLVSIDTLLDARVLEQRPMSSKELQVIGQHALALRENQSQVRVEDLLYLHTLACRFPSMTLPVERSDVDATIRRLGNKAMSSRRRGRVRRLAFACECLGRTGSRFRDMAHEAFSRLSTEVRKGALTTSERTISDHQSPRCLKERVELIVSYNASLVLRNAKFILDGAGLGRLREWARRMFVFAGAPAIADPTRPSSGSSRPTPYADLLADRDSVDHGLDDHSEAVERQPAWVERCGELTDSPAQAVVYQGYAKAQDLQKLQANRQSYALFVDEVADSILVRPAHLNRTEHSLPIEWSRLSAQMRRLLGLILCHWRDGLSTLWYSEIEQRVLLKAPGTLSESRFRDLKMKLNAALHGLVDELCTPNPGQQSYNLTKVPKYCWIRPDKTRSLLLA